MRRALWWVMALAVSAPAWAEATFTIVNVDEEGVGLNESTPAEPVGGNEGTTLGEQRRNVFREATRIWGAALDSDLPIVLEVSFAPLDCTETEGILGGARPGAYFSFNGAPRPNTWYVRAEASRLAGERLGRPDIVIQFSASLDRPDCLGGVGWYYGFDHRHGDKRDLLNVTLHEIGHGLGFLSLADDAFHYDRSVVDVWSYHLYDPATGKHWNELTDAERALSGKSGRLAWDGPAVKSLAPTFLGSEAVLKVTAAGTASLLGTYRIAEADFGAPITPEGLAADLVRFPGPDAGCSPSPVPVDGKIAVVDRGTCFFVVKAAHAQDAGAVGLLIVNNASGLVSPSGDAADIAIPVAAISQGDGEALKAGLDLGVVSGALVRDASHLAGTEDGRLLMYSPDSFQEGSSVSHWDQSARPDLLMEPFLTDELDGGLDLTVALLRDIDWFKTDLALEGTATRRGSRVSVALDVVNRSPSASDTATVTLELTDATVVSASGSCAAFPCELTAMAAKERRSIIVELDAPAAGGVRPSARFKVASSSNFNPGNDGFDFSESPPAPQTPGCGCHATNPVWSGLLALAWGARRRRSGRRDARSSRS